MWSQGAEERKAEHQHVVTAQTRRIPHTLSPFQTVRLSYVTSGSRLQAAERPGFSLWGARVPAEPHGACGQIRGSKVFKSRDFLHVLHGTDSSFCYYCAVNYRCLWETREAVNPRTLGHKIAAVHSNCLNIRRIAFNLAKWNDYVNKYNSIHEYQHTQDSETVMTNHV